MVACAGAAALSFDEMVAHLLDQDLMKQKIPEQLEHVDALPRNASGKVLKKDLREPYWKDHDRRVS